MMDGVPPDPGEQYCTVNCCPSSCAIPLTGGADGSCVIYVSSEMDKDAVSKMGMTTADVTAMIAAWSANVAAWRQAIYEAGLFEWFMVYGGQQTAPGWSQTQPNSTCLSFMRKNCGAESPSQNGTMFFGYSRYQHSQAWGNTSIPGQSYGSLLSPTQECVTSRAPPKIYGCGWR
jgi:hypothetical protein